MKQMGILFGAMVWGWAGCIAPARAWERGQNLLANPGFEATTGWQPVGEGFVIDDAVAHRGHRSLRCTNLRKDTVRGACQVITLDPPVRHPFRIAGWSRAENAVVGQDYNLYLDLHYDDGTPLWGQIAPFEPGTHGWQYSERVFDVAKPVQTIEVFVLFRKAQGTVWFDDLEVSLVPFKLREVRLLPGFYGGGSLEVIAHTTLPARWEATLEGPEGLVARNQGERMPVQLSWSRPIAARGRKGPSAYRLRISATDDLQGETLCQVRTVPLSPRPGRAYAVWTESSMRRVMPHALPEQVPAPPRVHLSLAGHEYESFQVVLRAAPGRELHDVRVELSDLLPASGRPPSPLTWQWHQVGYVWIEKPWNHPQVPDAVPGWWPDPLLPVEHFDLSPGFTQPLWVTVYAPPRTPPGEYVGSLTLRPKGQPATRIPLQVTVYGFTLPVEGHLKTAFALMDGFLERVYGKPLSAALRQRYGDFLLQHRLNPDDISRTSPPAIEDLLHYRDRGLNAFNVLNLVEERGEAPWVCFSPRETYTPAFKQRLIERLDPYVEQLRRTGLIEKAYIYGFDERGEDFYPIIREYFGMIQERYPEIHTLTTAKVPQDPAVMRDLHVDWNCPLTAAYRFEQAEKCRAAGQQVWAYVCLGPRYPYANWLADDPLIEARVIGWQAYQQQMDGLLYWGLNIWDRPHNDRPIDPSAGPFLDWSITTGGDYDWLHGDGRLLYAGPAGPLGSIRLANLRDGLEDYEYLWLLSQQAGDREVGRAACRPVTRGLTTFTRDPHLLSAQRQALARRIEAGN